MASPTATRILDIAERLIQTRGYNAFSFADISEELGIEKASVHYHFPSKTDLGKDLVLRYRRSFGEALSAIEREIPDAPGRLKRYVQLYLDVLRDPERICLCGMLAAEVSSLPRAVQEEVRRFFDDNETWLIRVLSEGRRAKSLRFNGSPEVEARTFLMGLEGAMMVARCYRDPRRFRTTARRLLAGLSAPKRS